MRLTALSTIIIGACCFTSCSNGGDAAKELVTNFFTAATDSTAGMKVKDIYPMYDSLHVEVKRDVLDFNDDIQKKGDTIIMSGQNSYTGTDGVFKQDSVKFYVAKNKDGNLTIVDSEGLIETPSYLKDFAKQIGLKNFAIQDLKKSKEISELAGFYQDKCFEAYIELRKGVKITYWDWETDYSNEPHGQAWIINNTGLTIYNVKYTVNYNDRNGGFISSDTGTACSKLSPGEKYRFTFYTSHVKNPSTANISLDFASSNVENIVASKGYTLKDFKKYCKEQNKK